MLTILNFKHFKPVYIIIPGLSRTVNLCSCVHNYTWTISDCKPVQLYIHIPGLSLRTFKCNYKTYFLPCSPLGWPTSWSLLTISLVQVFIRKGSNIGNLEIFIIQIWHDIILGYVCYFWIGGGVCLWNILPDVWFASHPPAAPSQTLTMFQVWVLNKKKI